MEAIQKRVDDFLHHPTPSVQENLTLDIQELMFTCREEDLRKLQCLYSAVSSITGLDERVATVATGAGIGTAPVSKMEALKQRVAEFSRHPAPSDKDRLIGDIEVLMTTATEDDVAELVCLYSIVAPPTTPVDKQVTTVASGAGIGTAPFSVTDCAARVIEGAHKQNYYMQRYERDIGSPCTECALAFLAHMKKGLSIDAGVVDDLLQQGCDTRSKLPYDGGQGSEINFGIDTLMDNENPTGPLAALVSTPSFARAIINTITAKGEESRKAVTAALVNRGKTYGIYSDGRDHFYFFDSHGKTAEGIEEACILEFNSQDSFREFLSNAPIFFLDPALLQEERLSLCLLAFPEIAGDDVDEEEAVDPGAVNGALKEALGERKVLLERVLQEGNLSVLPEYRNVLNQLSELDGHGAIDEADFAFLVQPYYAPTTTLERVQALAFGVTDHYTEQLHCALHDLNVEKSIGFKERLFEKYNQEATLRGLPAVNPADHQGNAPIDRQLFLEHFDVTLQEFGFLN